MLTNTEAGVRLSTVGYRPACTSHATGVLRKVGDTVDWREGCKPFLKTKKDKGASVEAPLWGKY